MSGCRHWLGESRLPYRYTSERQQVSLHRSMAAHECSAVLHITLQCFAAFWCWRTSSRAPMRDHAEGRVLLCVITGEFSTFVGRNCWGS